MISGIHVEVLLGVAYAIVLVTVACVLERVARHSHKRADRYRNSGFVYFQKTDHWECPAGRQLQLIKINDQRRVSYYRASAHECNACSLKPNCTDSDDGRLLERRLDRWLESELRRFHRGVSLALLLLATVLLVAVTVRHSSLRELLIVGTLLFPVGLIETRLLASFLSGQHS
jgi:Transposase DDE domain